MDCRRRLLFSILYFYKTFKLTFLPSSNVSRTVCLDVQRIEQFLRISALLTIGVEVFFFGEEEEVLLLLLLLPFLLN